MTSPVLLSAKTHTLMGDPPAGHETETKWYWSHVSEYLKVLLISGTTGVVVQRYEGG